MFLKNRLIKFARNIFIRLFSAELVSIAYASILGRVADRDGLASYSRSLAKSSDLSSLITELVSSEEFKAKIIDENSTFLVQSIFRGLLDRDPDIESLEYYRNRINISRDLAEIIREISRSSECYSKFINIHAVALVQSIYNGLLNRAPDFNGIDIYAKILKDENDVAAVLKAIVDSREFSEKAFVKSVEKQNKIFVSEDGSKDEKIVFLHLPKTGGTTLHNLLINNFHKDKICPERFNGLRNYSTDQLGKFELYSGHFDLPSVNLIPGTKKIIMMIRDPVERLISLYYFQRSHRHEVIERNNLGLARLANKYLIADFFKASEVRSHLAINNSMTAVLTQSIECNRWEEIPGELSKQIDASFFAEKAMRELNDLSAFGIMERFDESVELIFSTINLPLPRKIEKMQVLDSIMMHEPGLKKIEREPVTQVVRALISDLVKVDMYLYKEACKIFDQRVAALRGLVN